MSGAPFGEAPLPPPNPDPVDPTALVFGGGEDWDEGAPEPLPLEPAPPASPPAPALVVLGRFQPFHRGHAALVSQAISGAMREEGVPAVLRLTIGSANRQPSLDDPWTWEERARLIRAWWEDEGALIADTGAIELDIVAIPDIDDPPNWVDHAQRYHGLPGVLVTSDEPTLALYAAAGWPVRPVSLSARDAWEGWRIRETMRMFSTVPEREAVRPALQSSVPPAVLDIMLDEGWLWRLSRLAPLVDRA